MYVIGTDGMVWDEMMRLVNMKLSLTFCLLIERNDEEFVLKILVSKCYTKVHYTSYVQYMYR